MSKRTLFLNSLSGVALLATNILVAFVMSPIIIHALGNRNYGIWELLLGLVGYLGLLELGIGPALVRYVADAWSREDRIALERIFNTGAFALAGVGIIGLLIFVVGAMWLEHFSSITVSEARELTPVLVAFGFNLAVTLPCTALSAYLLGLQAHRFVNMLQIIVIVIQSFAIYHVLAAEWQSPLIWMALVIFCGTILRGLLMVLWIVAIDRRVRIAVSFFSIKTMKELLGFGMKSAIIGASAGMLNKLISIVIASTAGVGQVVYFVLASRLVEYARSLGVAIGFPLTPYFTDLAGKGDQASVRHAWIQTTRILQIVMLGAPLATASFGQPFIQIWIGQEYAEHGRWVLYILSAGLFAQGIVPNGARILLSLAKHGPLAAFSTIFALVCFGASFVFGSIWGIEGAAAAVSLYVVGISTAAVTLTCRALGVSVSQYYRDTVLHFVIPITVTGSVLIGLRYIAYPTGYGELLLHGLLACTVYLITVWFIALHSAERKLLKSIIVRRLDRLDESRTKLDPE